MLEVYKQFITPFLCLRNCVYNISPFLFIKDNITAVPIFGPPTLEVIFLTFCLCVCAYSYLCLNFNASLSLCGVLLKVWICSCLPITSSLARTNKIARISVLLEIMIPLLFFLIYYHS